MLPSGVKDHDPYLGRWIFKTVVGETVQTLQSKCIGIAAELHPDVIKYYLEHILFQKELNKEIKRFVNSIQELQSSLYSLDNKFVLL